MGRHSTGLSVDGARRPSPLSDFSWCWRQSHLPDPPKKKKKKWNEVELGPGHHLQVGSRWAMSFGIAKSGLGAYTGNHIIFLSISIPSSVRHLVCVGLGSRLWLSESIQLESV